MLSGGLTKLVYRLMGQTNMLIQTGVFNILIGKFQYARIGIIATDIQCEILQTALFALLSFCYQRIPQRLIML